MEAKLKVVCAYMPEWWSRKEEVSPREKKNLFNRWARRLKPSERL
jgi:hypothetical protein